MQCRIPNVMNVRGKTIQLPTLAATAHAAISADSLPEMERRRACAVREHEAHADERQE